MRISETLVAQHVDSDPPQVVFRDDATGQEVALDPAALIRAEAAIAYFRSTGALPTTVEACEAEDHPMFRHDSSYGAVLCACGQMLYDAITGDRIGLVP